MDMEDGLDIFRPPHPDYFAQHPHHLWDAGKLGLDLDDVFTTLPKQFNLMAIPILDRESFLLETQHVSFIAHDLAEFYTLLQRRVEARRKEQTKMMMHALRRLAGDPEQIDLPNRGDRHWGHAMHIARSKSYDTIVRFLAGFLRDEEPHGRVATLAAGQHDHLTRQPEAASPDQSSENAPSGPPPEIFARRSPSGSSSDKSQKPSTASSPRTRKRPLTPATANSEDEDEARPTKKLRFADDMVEPRTASSSRRPVSPRARRAHKGLPPSAPQPALSTVPPTTMTPSPSGGSRHRADGAVSSDPTEQRGNVNTAPQIHLGNSRQQTGFGSIHPDEKDGGNNDTRDKHDHGLAATGAQTSQGSRRPRRRKGKPPSASPCTKYSSKVEKSVTLPPDRRASRTRTGQGSRSGVAVHQTRPSQRLTRQRRQGASSFHELDSHGKARSVVP
ncbi:hypothetical protein F5883DRAFT_153467 [Diaporthe sp. PMI_573]|nr:hypothetical protein F5883DRAFT_153467 [Diaporthaceae sp. PMI_573]